jgi:tetratricopeptide (TPR) repeat protein
MNWDDLVRREEARYVDGLDRLPDDPDRRQRQLVRVAMAAGAVGLCLRMRGDRRQAEEWLERAAVRYRESYEDAPPGSWGRLLGAVKSRLLAGDLEGARDDARWALEQCDPETGSAIARYASVLSLLTLGMDEAAAPIAEDLEKAPEDVFPGSVARALAGLATRDPDLYGDALTGVLASFVNRDDYLEDVPVADTVLVLEALAEPRGLAVRPRSPLLPE